LKGKAAEGLREFVTGDNTFGPKNAWEDE